MKATLLISKDWGKQTITDSSIGDLILFILLILVVVFVVAPLIVYLVKLIL